MKRRSLLQIAGLSAALTVPMLAKAATPESPVCPPPDAGVSFQTEIGNNHGHDLVLDIHQVIALFAATQGGATVELSIQGASGHDHGFFVDQDLLVQLLATKQVAGVSEDGASHTHPVTITLSETV